MSTSHRHLPNDEFFAVLRKLLHAQSAARRGSIWLTQKRMPPTTPGQGQADPTTAPTLIRVTNGKHKSDKAKASTVVAHDDLEGFYAKYAEVCKEGMVAMRKRDRSGKKKAKGKGKK